MSKKYEFKGRLEVVCGSMFSGKTEELIRRIKKVELAGKKYTLSILSLAYNIRPVHITTLFRIL